MLANVERLQQKMDAEGLDGLVATTIENVHYLSGVRSVSLHMFPHEGQCYAIITRDRPTEPFFISSVGEVDQVLDGVPGIRGAVTFGTFFREGPESGLTLDEREQRLKKISVETEPAKDPLSALVRGLEQMGLDGKKVGVDELGFRAGYLDALRERLPEGDFVPSSATFRWVRRVKTAEEIRRIRDAAKVTERAMLAASAIMREGVTEEEMEREFNRSVVSQGAIPMFTLLRFGRNAVAGQVLPDRTPLQRGDTVWFDVGCIYQGYWSDIARNFSLDEPSRRARQMYDAMLAGEEHAIAETRAGMTGGELFDLTVGAVRDAGASHYRRHHVGHGIGAEVYEAPLLAPGVEDVIEEGMVINIETPYYEFGLGALHVEDPFVVRAGGNEVLTTLGRELHIIP